MLGRGSSAGIATDYGLEGPEIESQGGGARFSTGGHPASCTVGTGSFPGVESGLGVTLIPQPLVVLMSINRVELYLYSP